jgi:hypothetical protein
VVASAVGVGDASAAGLLVGGAAGPSTGALHPARASASAKDIELASFVTIACLLLPAESIREANAGL